MYTLSSVKVFFFLCTIAKVNCDNDYNDSLNLNMYDSKNIIYKNGNSMLQKMLIDSKFNSDIIKNFDKNKNTDAVNHYEDITVLDKTGQLKNLKFKAANVPKIPESLKNKVQYQLVTKVSNKVTNSRDTLVTTPVKLAAVGDKVTDKLTSDSQVEKPVTAIKDVVQIGVNGLKSKFFEELGCEYLCKINYL